MHAVRSRALLFNLAYISLARVRARADTHKGVQLVEGQPAESRGWARPWPLSHTLTHSLTLSHTHSLSSLSLSSLSLSVSHLSSLISHFSLIILCLSFLSHTHTLISLSLSIYFLSPSLSSLSLSHLYSSSISTQSFLFTVCFCEQLAAPGPCRRRLLARSLVTRWPSPGHRHGLHACIHTYMHTRIITRWPYP